MTKAEKLALAAAAVFCAAVVSGCSERVAALKRSDAKSRGATVACYGIARAGMNDCKTSSNVCGGWSRWDGDPNAFVYVPPGLCERIVGGRPGTS